MGEDKELMKEAMKEAIKEWMNEKYITLGKWTLRTLAIAGLTAVIYFILTMSGWHK